MLKTSFALALVFATSMTPAFAQGGRGGTQKEQEACTRDVTRHCRKVLGEGDFVILRCLQDNRKKLSRACLQVLQSHGQ